MDQGDGAPLDAALVLSQLSEHAVITMDPAGTITAWNLGAERLTGHTADQAIGRAATLLYADDDCLLGTPAAQLATARTEGHAERQGWRMRRDGSRLWADSVITALHDGQDGQDGHDGGRLVGFAEVIRDVTAHKQVEDAQASFLASIAHDFRTPIAALKGFAELVHDAPDDQRADFLRRIDANADRLLAMLADLGDYAIEHSPAADRRPETFDLAALTRETVLAMGSQADLDRVVLPSGTVLVRADRAGLQRIVTNLVDNALKYSESGPVGIDVSNGDDRVRLSVSDQGRGIHPDDLAGIFTEFERGRLATSDGGTGLGLASVKRLVEGQGGQVHLQSVVGQGTVVTVELPGVGARADAATA